MGLLDGLTPETLDALRLDDDAVMKEHEDVVHARAAHHTVSSGLAAQQVELAQQLVEVNQQSNAIVGQNLDDIETALHRSREIDHSFPLKIIEPFANMLGLDNYSRRRLAKNIDANQQDIKVATQRTALKTSGIIDQSQALDTQSKAAALELDNETGQYNDASTARALTMQSVIDGEQMKALAIDKASEDEVPSLQQTLHLTDEEVRVAVTTKRQTKESKELALNAQRQNAYLTNLQIQRAEVSNLSEEDLTKPEILKKYPIQLIREHEQSIVGSRIAFNQGLRADATLTRTDEEIAAQGESGEGGATKYSAGEELKRREKQRVADARQAESDMQNAGKLWTTYQNSDTLAATLQDALTKGVDVAEVKDPESKAVLKIPIGELKKALIQKEAESAELAADLNTTSLNQQSQVNYAQGLARATGTVVEPDATVPATLQAIIDNPNVPPTEKARARQTMNSLKAANNTAMTAITRGRLLTESTDALKTQHDETVARVVMTQGGESNKAATTDYFYTGRINSADGALGVLSTAATSNAGAGSFNLDGVMPKPYAKAMSILNQNVFNKDGKIKDAHDIQRMLDKAKPNEAVAEWMSDETSQEKIASPIVSAIIKQAHVMAANRLGLPELATAIQSGTIFKGQGIQSSAIVQYLQTAQTKITLDQYVEALSTSSVDASKDVTNPVGEQQVAMAAINRVVFHNNPTGYGREFTLQMFHQGMRDVTTAKDEAARSGFAGGRGAASTQPEFGR